MSRTSTAPGHGQIARQIGPMSEVSDRIAASMGNSSAVTASMRGGQTIAGKIRAPRAKGSRNNRLQHAMTSANHTASSPNPVQLQQ